MTAVVQYSPPYYCELRKPNPQTGVAPIANPQGAYGRFAGLYGPPAFNQPSGPPTISWSLKTLKAAQVSLSTTNVGSATISLYDHGKYLTRVVDPHAMNLVMLCINNRFGGPPNLPVFTGYVDEAHRIIDPAQGETMELLCTSPYKLFEMTSQTPGDVVALATAYMQNISGSQVLKLAAKECGFPSDMLVIDSSADSGSGLWTSLPSGVFIDPDQQKWSTPLQQLLGNSGLECFTDEQGRLHWRPLGYLGQSLPPGQFGPSLPPRPILEDEILHADLAESDRTAVTYVEVRYGIIPTTFGAPNWQAPSGMVTHLRQRRLIVHAPWIQNAAAAQYLATALGQMYAANLLIGSVTIPADPTFQIGTLCQVPLLRPDQTTGVYYISAINYQLEWGGPWTMTLGLSYGRAPNQSFPYIGTISKPILSREAQAGFPQQNQNLLSYDGGNPAQITNAFTVVANPTLANNAIVLDPNLGLPVGTIVYLRTKAGRDIGPSPNGEYSVQSGVAGQGYVVDIMGTANLASDGLGYLTVRQGTAAAPTTTSGAQGGSTPQTGSTGTPPGATTNGTGGGQPRQTTIKTTPGGNLSQRALRYALTFEGNQYIYADSGPTAFDCAGLVLWCFAQMGFKWGQSVVTYNGNVDPTGNRGVTYYYNATTMYTFFQAAPYKAKPIPVSAANVGDLIFHTDLSHVGWLRTTGPNALSFAACNPTDGVRSFTVASEHGTGYGLALDMSSVGLTNS